MFVQNSRNKLLVIGIMIMFLMIVVSPSGATATQASPTASGFQALNGVEAADYSLPSDIELITRFETASGLTYERYQQLFGDVGAQVLGGQLTLYRDANGEIAVVIGAHYSEIAVTNNVNLTAAAARSIVAGDIGAAGQRLIDLMIDPDSGHYFYQVETRRADSRWIHWINAESGRLINKFNALAHDCDGTSTPCGFGVQYPDDSSDVKDLTGLTTMSGGQYLLRSSDGRQETHDQGSTRRPFLGPVATDADNSWILLGDESPAQQALVDAHYYANVVDEYYDGVYNYDWVAEASAAGANDRMVVHAHYSADYNNAFWNGTYIALGDGDQVSFEELTSLDVIGHELTHGVTDFTSDLIYQNESGALNEAFSDIMGSSMEFWAEANGLEPATSLQPDWLIGEDFDLRGDAMPGFRNMADPGEDGDPSHYDERYTGTSDNGGVHINSSIANHWYYLLVNGGQNSDSNFASGTAVTGIGLAAAEPIAFMGFTALPANATFCDARAGTITLAGAYQANVADAWDEVGVDSALCSGGTTDAPPSVNITSPADNASFNSGELISFAGSSSDNEDGNLTGSLVWTSDLLGQIGTGGSFAATLSNGTHTITAEVTDGAGQTGSDSITITVGGGSGSDFSLSVTAYKVRGFQYADLIWDGAESTNVDVIRNGNIIATTANDGAYTDSTGQKGGGLVASYQICEAGTGTCSNTVNVIW